MMCSYGKSKYFRKYNIFLLLIFASKTVLSFMSHEGPNYWEQIEKNEDFGKPFASLSRNSFVSKKMDESDNEPIVEGEKSFQNKPKLGKCFTLF